MVAGHPVKEVKELGGPAKTEAPSVVRLNLPSWSRLCQHEMSCIASKKAAVKNGDLPENTTGASCFSLILFAVLAF